MRSINSKSIHMTSIARNLNKSDFRDIASYSQHKLTVVSQILSASIIRARGQLLCYYMVKYRRRLIIFHTPP